MFDSLRSRIVGGEVDTLLKIIQCDLEKHEGLLILLNQLFKSHLALNVALVLYGAATDTGEAIATYRKIHAEQIKFRGTSHTLEDALHDTQMAAYHVCRIGGQKQDAANSQALEQREILARGIAALGSHLFTEPFQRAESQIAAAKAALAARMILHDATDFNISEFLSESYNPLDLKAAELTGPWEHISQPLKRATWMPSVSGIERRR